MNIPIATSSRGRNSTWMWTVGSNKQGSPGLKHHDWQVIWFFSSLLRCLLPVIRCYNTYQIQREQYVPRLIPLACSKVRTLQLRNLTFSTNFSFRHASFYYYFLNGSELNQWKWHMLNISWGLCIAVNCFFKNKLI